MNNRPGGPIISADAKDENFYAAIFGNDNDAIPDMTADELEQARQYIIRGEGEMPVRKGHIVRRGAVKPASATGTVPSEEPPHILSCLASFQIIEVTFRSVYLKPGSGLAG